MEDEDQGFMLLVLGVLAAVLMAVIWYVISDDGTTSVAASASAVAVDADADLDAEGDAGVDGSDAAAAAAVAGDLATGDTADDTDDDAPDPTATAVPEPTATPKPTATPEPTATAEPASASGDTSDTSDTSDSSDTADTSDTGDTDAAATPTDDDGTDDDGNDDDGTDDAAELDPVSIIITAAGNMLTLEGQVPTEFVSGNVQHDAEAIVGRGNVTNLLEIDDSVDLKSGLLSTIRGTVETEQMAVQIREMAGVSNPVLLEIDDQLLVGDPDEVVPDALTSLFAFNPITFASGSANLDESSLTPLDEAARVLTANPDVRVLISGHTDNEGDEASNVELSQARAEAVRTQLVDNGVDPAQIEAEGFGSSQPVADNDTESGREKNRRIEFTLLES